MKLNKPENEAYAATIVKLENTYPLDNSDNLVGSRFFGYSAVISKEYPLGLYVMFPAEAQLSEKYCYENNLHRHGNLNKDTLAKGGYLEDNRRVRAIKLRGNTSNAIIMPLESLAFTGVNVADFQEGDVFDELNGVKICEKYVVKSDKVRELKMQTPRFSRVDERLLPKHFKTPQFWRHEKQFLSKFVTVTQKLHGTSVRIANIPVAKPLTWKDKVAKKFGVSVNDHVHDYVYGTRNVIKDVNNPSQNSFYSEDIYTANGEKVKDAVPKNHIIYGEIIGWVNKQKPIQPKYTYNLKPGTNELYVYRVAVVNPDGLVRDLSWEAVKEFCNELGLNHVPQLWEGYGRDLDVDWFMNRMYYWEGWENVAVPLSDLKTKDEGICIRYEAQIPVVAKAKCSEFLGHETKMLDKGEVDTEES